MFHLLHHHSGTGGRSLLVDGFRAAEKLKAANGRAYEVLSQFRVPAHASGNAGISIQPAVPFPVFNHHPVSGDLVQIRWNNSDRATIRHQHEHSAMEDWYDAAREWVELMTREEAELWDQLEPGRPLSEHPSHLIVLTKLTIDYQYLTTGESCTAVLRLQGLGACVEAIVSSSSCF